MEQYVTVVQPDALYIARTFDALAKASHCSQSHIRKGNAKKFEALLL